MTKIKNKTVLITGGASGLGKLMAERCLKEEAFKVVLWDINETALAAVKEEFATQNIGEVVTYKVDVSQTQSIVDAAATVLNEVGTVDIVFNNAGIVVGKSFEEHSHKDIDQTININVLGVMHVARAFLPAMIEQGSGHIINIASAAGLIPNPNMSVYASSKWAVVGWSESLRLEMEATYSDIHVTTVEPSYINTGMFDGVKAPMLTPIMEAPYIVDKIMKGVKNNAIIVREPFMVNAVPILRGILPTRVFDFMAKQMGVYDSMNDFKGKH